MEESLAGIVRTHGRERADHEAIVCGDVRRTWAQLHERSSRLAHALIADGVGPGDRVAILSRNAAEHYELAFACAKAAAVLVGLNWRLAAPELAGVLADCEPSVVVVEDEHRALVGDTPARVVSVAPAVADGGEYEAWLARCAPDDPAVAHTPDDPVLALYSSGTTGRPKGVMITHANLALTGRMAREVYRMDAQSTNMVPSPLFHIGGAGYGLTAMYTGGTTVLMREAAPALLLETIARERVTHAFMVPAVVQALVDDPVAADTDLSTLRFVAYGGAPMNEALLRRAMTVLGCGFLGVYGMTETSGSVVALGWPDHDPDGERSRLLRSIGRPLAWVDLRVADVATGAELAPGEVGEIWIRSAQNMPGYWRQPETTAQTLVADGWLRTGDGAYRDEEGFVFLQDRIKDMIISGGENVYPAEVENALADHPAIADVAVIGVAHERWGETVKAVVVAWPGATVDADEVRAFARARLAGYKCPTSVDVVDELPRNASGKLLKKVLREAYGAEGA